MIFKIYENCKVVNGVTESAILDLLEGTYTILPLEYGKLLQGNSFSKEEIEDNEMDSFFDSLIELGLGEYNDYQVLLSPLDENLIPSGKVTNAILEVSKIMEFDIFLVLSQLEILGCKAIEFIFIKSWSLDELDRFFSRLEDTRFTYFNVILMNSKISQKHSSILENKYQRIARIKQRGTSDIPNLKTAVARNINVPPINKITINIKVYFESQKLNAGINGKIAIDSKGDIRNYKNHDFVFGNIKNIKLDDILLDSKFVSQWQMNNDKIEKCKSCQFRYSCVDFSLVTKKDSQFLKKEDCSFDPFKPLES